MSVGNSQGKKPRTISGKKKYGSVLSKTPDIQRKKHVKTEEKITEKFDDGYDHYGKAPKRKNSTNMKFVYENVTTNKVKTNPSVIGVSGSTYSKQSLEKKDGKKYEGLGRFFYRRGKQLY